MYYVRASIGLVHCGVIRVALKRQKEELSLFLSLGHKAAASRFSLLPHVKEKKVERPFTDLPLKNRALKKQQGPLFFFVGKKDDVPFVV